MNRTGVAEINNTPMGYPVLVYRPGLDIWYRTYYLLEIRGEDVIARTSKGASKFRSTSVKPYRSKALFEISSIHENMIQQRRQEKQPFAESRIEEFSGLMALEVITIVPASDTDGFRVYGSRFVDQTKQAGEPGAYAKSRLVSQSYNDSKQSLLTHAPTVQRSSQRMLLIICYLDGTLKFFTRDIFKAFTQSKNCTERPIFVRPPNDINLPADWLFRVDFPLCRVYVDRYRVPEAGLHW